jgi:hypothetical protein
MFSSSSPPSDRLALFSSPMLSSVLHDIEPVPSAIAIGDALEPASERVAVPLESLVEASIQGCVYDLALVVFALYSQKYVCAKVKTRQWFVFEGHHWSFSEIGPYHDISTHMVKIYEDALKREKEKDREDPVRIGALSRLVSKLKNVNFKEMLMKECTYMFYQAGFCTKLDRARSLLCFKNGVLDVTQRVFRAGRPDDHLSLYIDSDYPGHDTGRRIQEFVAFRDDIIAKRITDTARNSQSRIITPAPTSF